jgi:hypothetical protein
MTHNTNTPEAEAKVQVRVYGGEWRDSPDFEPVMIPVEDFEASTVPYLTDSFNSNVIGLVDALISLDCPGDTEYNLVWSDSGFSVKANCPVCDDVFPVAEGAPGDELNEGYDAVFCGCDPADQEYGEFV